MSWIKKGLVWKPNPSLWWQQYYGILPTPEYLEKEQRIRVYFATACKDKYGRITYIDLDANDPSKVLYEAPEPILDIGDMGTFDDCGVNVSAIVNTPQGQKMLYYVGYQRTVKVPYMLYAGLAIAPNQSNHFERVQTTPIIGRSEQVPLSAAAPFVLLEEGVYKMWFWVAKKWTTVNEKLYLQASIGYAESNDGIHWDILNTACMEPNPQTEFSLGRPYVLKTNGLYQMWYSVRYIDKLYRIGYAESHNGQDWIRKDETVGIDVSPEGWDSEMICYPAVLRVKDKLYLFYNGNNNGMTGFGYAEYAQPLP